MGVFAVTGNLASGKSTVLNLLKNKGAAVFDVDAQIHKYYKDAGSPVYKGVCSAFPEAVEKGIISRRRLSKIVFSDNKKLRRLEKIVHPAAISCLKRWVQKVKKKKGVFIAEVPLLFEKGLNKLFDGTILVYVKKEVLIKRIRMRLALSENAARKRLAYYLPIRVKTAKSQFVVDNNGDFRELKKQINSVWNKLRRKNGQKK